MVPTMFDNDNKNDTRLTNTKSTKLDVERSKREDCNDTLSLVCKSCKNEVRYLDKPNRKEISCKCGALNSTET